MDRSKRSYYDKIIPPRYSDDGCINPDYIEWDKWQDERDTILEQEWEARRDDEISYFTKDEE